MVKSFLPALLAATISALAKISALEFHSDGRRLIVYLMPETPTAGRAQ